jgi:BirA family biotin operon repressor/biotin-[acetyl-CoA-carboxylase] ligase
VTDAPKELTADVDMDLLGAFYEAGGQAVGVSGLSQKLGLSLEEIAERVEKMRAAGYVIGKSHPYGSTAFQMLEIPDRFYVHEIRRRLATEWLGGDIRSYDRVPSTNQVARAALAEGAGNGTVIVAEEQAEGRGRAGRVWYSAPRRGIYVSLILRPEAPIESAATFQIATAVAVAHTAMKLTGKLARLRWPNDVMMSRGKVAGILAEAHDGGAWIVGIGLNVSHEAGDFPEELREEASSLALETGHGLSRLPVLPTLLSTLEEWYDRLFAGESEKIAEAWRPLSSLLGQKVVVFRGERKTEGVVRELSPENGVLIANDDGEAWIPAEHVTFIRTADDA